MEITMYLDYFVQNSNPNLTGPKLMFKAIQRWPQKRGNHYKRQGYLSTLPVVGLLNAEPTSELVSVLDVQLVLTLGDKEVWIVRGVV